MTHAWMFDLISPDDTARVRALTRHRELVRSRSGQTLFSHFEEFWLCRNRNNAVSAEQWRLLALYLRWEALYPDEWRSSDLWSPWTRKNAVLEHLGRGGVPVEGRREAADLLVDVLHRSYRCKEWMYPVLVRHIADEEFRVRLNALTGADDSLVGLGARFLLDLADRPGQKVTRKTWRHWLEDQR
ncbi:hypothetical protein ACFWN2_01805 [Lentzea sp. NPDC058436]|uniref:hypothetical protein n=1 Tax=Lentzea sp. NPDC058436 TaxID=3346499 RepID=UPI003663D49C